MIASLRRIGLTGWIIIAMIVGITLGWLDHDLWHDTTITPVAQPLATLFLRMIKSIVVPLVFSSLVVGIAGHGDDLKKVGRLALRSLVYFELVTTVALGIGLLAVNLARPGAGVDIQSASAELGQQFASTHTTLSGVLEHAVPQSFFEAAAKNVALQMTLAASCVSGMNTALRRSERTFSLDSPCDAVNKKTSLTCRMPMMLSRRSR